MTKIPRLAYAHRTETGRFVFPYNLHRILQANSTTPISRQVGTFCKMQEKPHSFFITDKSTLTNIIVFCKYKQILILMAATHSQKVGTEPK